MNASLEGKVALVTGGTVGIGSASARELSARGARVFITGRRQAELDAAVATTGKGATGIRADASKLEELDRVYAQIAREAERLDIVFANAGGGDMLPLGSITEEHFDRIFGTRRWTLLRCITSPLVAASRPTPSICAVTVVRRGNVSSSRPSATTWRTWRASSPSRRPAMATRRRSFLVTLLGVPMAVLAGCPTDARSASACSSFCPSRDYGSAAKPVRGLP